MSGPAQYDIKVRRGNNVPVAWRFKNADGSLFGIGGDVFQLTIVWGGERIEASTEDSTLTRNDPQATISWRPTLEQTRDLPDGRQATYELERIASGEQRTLVEGFVVVEGGINGD